MDKIFDHKTREKEIYKIWEDGGYFHPQILKNKKPYTIVLPPPNASGKMHIGNVLMIAIEDLLIRWKRMQGYNALWLPGTDHAGFETQTTFERELKKVGKSRFDFGRKELYENIMEFVLSNKGLIEDQMRRMGASVDWERYTFTLDPKSIDIVLGTFKKLVDDGMIYRDDYIVNYSFKWGTTFSDAEINYDEIKSPLYFVKYKIINKDSHDPEYITVATIRPETIFVDTHLAINPNDNKTQFLLNRMLENPLTGKQMMVIKDSFVDPEFGTGIVKITPAHDKNDFEVAKRHNLEIISLIDLSGRLNENAGKFSNMKILEARNAVVEYLYEKNLIDKVDENYISLKPVDYRTGDYIEQLVIPNWFVKVDKMKKMAYDVLKSGELKIYPKWREITYKRWVENMHDWAISRQVVWGIQIPAWYDVDKYPNIKVTFLNANKDVVKLTISEALKSYTLEEIKSGIQAIIAPNNSEYIVSKECPGDRFIQETDVFDTWFSSGQWPLITLGYPDSEDFKYFYPTNVLETGWEIITRWVSRMVMFGTYLTGKSPFQDVYLHGMVRAIDGRKMSKSLGNVINPDDYLDKYGADVLRMGSISGTANGKDFNFPQEKIIGYRNFANKIWNMAKFLLIMIQNESKEIPLYSKDNEEIKPKLSDQDKMILDRLKEVIVQVTKSLDKYRFTDASDTIYHFMWDDLASQYIEYIKTKDDKTISLSILRYVYSESLKLLHPFMPFITEEIWSHLHEDQSILMNEKWPVI